uniref:Peptide methionine sulfoxide reductase msrB, putative, expressed n=1 Tax=Oryza sativa subsp. japonica TaxID=39947 RepID=Q10L31_ORYSJ|nr:Peptide methionine sulfoxide reductase msrB, putative, expressed [Oryza sativa Japonica Group]
MASSGDSSGKQRSDEEWRAVLSPEQFRILRLKGTDFHPGYLEQVSTTSSMVMGSTTVLAVEHPCTNPQPSLILVVAGQHFLRDFLEP